jgi:uncharacterized DUF497 family protein
MSLFEFDDRKSKANEQKHGISFTDAQRLWDDDRLIEVPARVVDEERFLITGRIDQRIWSAVITYRSEAIKIISVRRARPEEVEIYEG